MRSNFSICLQRVLRDEGGYSNNPADPGGPTNFGITIADYRKYIHPNATADDVRNMSVQSAAIIYKQRYWDALGCDNLPAGVDYTCFDYGVNSGVARPKRDLLRFSNLTGHSLIDAINNERLSFLQSLKTFSVFGKGWTRRVNNVRTYSHQMFGKKDNTTGPAVATGTVATGVALSQYNHSHEVLIIAIAALAAIGIGFLIHSIRNK
jgi:lysozyme family protein